MKIEYRKTKEPGIIQITCSDERWYLRESDSRFFPSVTWKSKSYPKGIGYMKWLAEKGWDEAIAIRDERGEFGSRVHNAVERLLMNGHLVMNEQFPVGDNGTLTEISTAEWEAVISFKAWYDEVKPEVIAIEQVCYNDVENYAGTMDLVLKIDGELFVVDLKTSQQVWPEHTLQVSAYRHADQFNGTIPKGAVLQIGYQKNKKLYKFTELEDRFDLFKAASLIWQAENEGISVKQKDYPTELTIERNGNGTYR